ncbi:MAG: YfhO family protein, partial [Bacteroidota bacterium]
MKTKWIRIIPHVIALVLFIIISYTYFTPLLEGKSIKQSDIDQYKGNSKELKEHREKTGEEALWTNRLFGGMPAYFIGTTFENNYVKKIDSLFKIGSRPASFLILYLLGFYVALLLMGVNPWLSLIGAFAYAFSSYFFIIIAAGHNTKAIAIAYMAPLIASIIYTYRRKLYLGLALTGIFLALIIKANHPQITYYAGITVIIYAIFEFFRALKEKQITRFVKISLLLLLPLVLAVGSNMGRLWTTLEYNEFSMRGESELEQDQNNQTSGLDKDYATKWSYGIDETFTLLIPNYKGGSSQGELSNESNTYKALKKNNVPTGRAKQFVKNAPLYHGNQPFTSGPVYVGALVFFLFVFSLYIVKGPIKWWVIAASVLAVMLAWGNNFMPLTNFFMEYVPGYNKFRAVSTTLVVVEFTVPLFAFLGLKQFFDNKISKEHFLKALKNSVYILGGICLLFILMPGIFQDFAGNSDGQLPGWLSEPLREDRKSLLRQDAFRSLIFILMGAGVLWAFYYKKLKYKYVIGLLGILILIDMWPVNKRYLNDENFASKQEVKNPFPKSQADQYILQDNEQYFRVLNVTVDIFNDASTSYYHNSIGGYHGAKLQRYQDMIEYHIQNEIQNVSKTLEGDNARQHLDQTLKDQEVLNMLNMKYIIYRKDARPIRNQHRLGNAWFVDDYELVPGAMDEIKALNDFDPAKTAIIDQRFEDELKEVKQLTKDTSGHISLTHYEPNHLKYEYQADSKQLAVFSEVYYPKGWKIFIDGEETELFRANYILRAATIPAGEHEIEMKFKPKSYYMGEKVSGYSSIILILFLIGVIGFEGYRWYKG